MLNHLYNVCRNQVIHLKIRKFFRSKSYIELFRAFNLIVFNQSNNFIHFTIDLFLSFNNLIYFILFTQK